MLSCTLTLSWKEYMPAGPRRMWDMWSKAVMCRLLSKIKQFPVPLRLWDFVDITQQWPSDKAVNSHIPIGFKSNWVHYMGKPFNTSVFILPRKKKLFIKNVRREKHHIHKYSRKWPRILVLDSLRSWALDNMSRALNSHESVTNTIFCIQLHGVYRCLNDHCVCREYNV